MTNPDPAATPTPTPARPARKPLDAEIDTYGLTHVGRVRAENQDNFLIATLHKQVEVHFSSLPVPTDQVKARQDDERLAAIAMVADGVGGGEMGEAASRLAVECVSRYVTDTIRCYYENGKNESSFTELLETAAQRCHERILAHAEQSGVRGMATTLTLFLGVWPHVYLLQVGDSRAYCYRNGTLEQITRDQTMAQELVDLGVLKAEVAQRSQLSHVLSSAIGGQANAPIVTRLEHQWGDIFLLCSDGLIRHVSDARIAEVLGGMTSARGAAETLLAEALQGGGSDNITIVVGRTIPRV